MVDISYQKYGYIITDDLNDNDSQYVLHILTHEIIENSFLNFSSSKSLIYKINKDNMKYMVHDINKLISSMCDALNISIFIENLRDYKLEDLFRYGQFLQNVADLIFDCWKCQKRVNINVLTHILFLDSHKNCGIGNNNITLGPDGKFYICPAFYYDLDLRNKYQIGDLNTGVKNNYQNSTFNINTNLCGKCDNYHCDKCVYMSLLGSGEFCVPTEIQCIKTNIERQATIYLLNKLKEYEISFWSYRKELSSYRYLDMLLNTDVKKRVVTNYGDILKGMAGND